MNSIDYVIPMVFPSDRQWLADYRRVSCRRPEREVRFRSWGTEQLLVQCVRRNLPFVRDIIILLARDSQVRPWMETENVRVVTHAEFIPKQFLPTFNSCAIEMFLHRIPGLSERFLYSNDDIFPLSSLQESDFFQDGRPCQHHTERGYPSQPNIFHKSCLAGINFVAGEFGLRFSDTWLKGGHSIAPILLSTCRHLWERGAREIEGSVTPFRAPRNFNQYIYGWHQHFSGNYIDQVPKRRFLSVKTQTLEEMTAAISQDDPGIVCINDHGCLTDFERYADAIRQAIRNKITPI